MMASASNQKASFSARWSHCSVPHMASLQEKHLVEDSKHKHEIKSGILALFGASSDVLSRPVVAAVASGVSELVLTREADVIRLVAGLAPQQSALRLVAATPPIHAERLQ